MLDLDCRDDCAEIRSIIVRESMFEMSDELNNARILARCIYQNYNVTPTQKMFSHAFGVSEIYYPNTKTSKRSEENSKQKGDSKNKRVMTTD